MINTDRQFSPSRSTPHEVHIASAGGRDPYSPANSASYNLIKSASVTVDGRGGLSAIWLWVDSWYSAGFVPC